MTLRSRLDDLAADAPAPAALDVDQLRGRIARRRRTRVASAGAAVVLTVAAVGTATAALLPRDDSDPPVAAEPSATPTSPLPDYPFVGCDVPFDPGEPMPDAPLTMDVQLASPVANLDGEIGDVTVTNVSDTRVEGSVGAGPILIVTQNGRVVGHPALIPGINMTIDVDPGESDDLGFAVHHAPCDQADPFEEMDLVFPPGSYEVYVGLEVTSNRVADFDDPFVWLYSGPVEVEVTG
ncbi:hypothetical protein [Jiangella muralis]|uniref:hypothetical protein n=1 Tax=Jiangella muralis TaxID=702383 RepID=UPI00069E6C86|nr:hypothetical protein [Jiangella muralis]